MNTHTIYNRGIGVFAVIAIVALIGLGGVAAAEVYQRQSISTTMDTEKTQAEVTSAKAAADKLMSIRALLNDKTAANVTVALQVTADIRAQLQNAYANTGAEAHAELKSFEHSLDTLEGEIRSGSDHTSATLDAMISGMTAGTNAHMNMNEDINKSSNNASSSVEDTTQVDADTSIESGGQTGGAQLHSETSVDGSLNF